MITLGQVLSIQIGQSERFDVAGAPADSWTSAISKMKVSGAVHIGNTGTAGDEAGMPIELVDRSCPELSIASTNSVMSAKPRRHEDDLRLAECSALSEAWQTNLEHRARKRAD